MQITSTQRNFATAVGPRVAQTPSEPTREAPADSYQPSSGTPLGEKLKGAAIMGGIGLVGAAVGAFAGNSSGILAGVAGAAVGLTGGASLASALPGEKIKTGAILGALGGAIVASSTGNPVAAVALGAAGATLPYGAAIGIASMLSV